ncbi:MAG: RecX family transcriptional regulator [Bacteroidales bacterium]|nr:RecX family transcriptional regulator [Bacteroidales bacterium]
MTKVQLLERLRSRCSRAEYSTAQVASYARQWLIRSGESAERAEKGVAEIMEVLVSEKFVDDERFAAAFVRDKLKFNRWGRHKIIYRLRALGVDEQIIAAAIEENYNGGADAQQGETPALDVLHALLVKKWEASKGKDALSIQARKAAAIRFAMSRGFDYEDIVKCLNNIV